MYNPTKFEFRIDGVLVDAHSVYVDFQKKTIDFLIPATKDRSFRKGKEVVITLKGDNPMTYKFEVNRIEETDLSLWTDYSSEEILQNRFEVQFNFYTIE